MTKKCFNFSLFWPFSSVQKYSKIIYTVLPSTSEDRAEGAGKAPCANPVELL